MKAQNIFVSFLDVLRVRHTREYSNKKYNEHPYKNNLFGLSKLLSDYGIENAGVRIRDKKEGLANLEAPFIAHSGGDFVMVHKLTPEKVHYQWNGKGISVPAEEFIESWNGTLLLAEPDENSIEPGYRENRKKEMFGILQKGLLQAAVLALFLSLYFYNGFYRNPGVSLLLLLNLAGIYVSYLLVLKQVHIHSEYADKICSLFKKADCNNVLESKAAKLWGVIGWSEVGLGYFIANVILLLLAPSLLPYLAAVNILALPYTVWSVWYQKVKARQWCPLCLIVQALLWGVFAVNLFSGFIRVPDFTWMNVILAGVIYGIPLLAINQLTPVLGGSRKSERITQKLNSFKATEEVFAALLKKEPHYRVEEEDSRLIWGEKRAPVRITVLTNPHCNPCARMHDRLHQLQKEAGDRISVQYIMTSFNEELEASAKYLIAVYLQYGPEAGGRIIDEWFESGKGDKEAFFKKYPADAESPAVGEEHDRHARWKQETGFRATPTILVNGYKLPEDYRVEDLRYMTNLIL